MMWGFGAAAAAVPRHARSAERCRRWGLRSWERCVAGRAEAQRGRAARERRGQGPAAGER